MLEPRKPALDHHEWSTFAMARVEHITIQSERPQTIGQLFDRFMAWARCYYRKPSTRRPTGTAEHFVSALRPLLQLAEDRAIEEMTAELLIDAQQRMIRLGWSRKYVNVCVNKIRYVFRWGAQPPRRYVSATLVADLANVDPLRPGRSPAKENQPVRPADEALINGMLQHVSSVVRAMIQLQLLTGMRPGEVVIMRACDIDRTRRPWVYRPVEHKTQHHGKDRVVTFGPRAERIIKPFVRRRAARAYLFSPQEATQEWLQIRYWSRLTPAAWGNTVGTNRVEDPKRSPGDRYTVTSYCRAVQRGCDRAYPHPTLEAKKPLTDEERKELARWRCDHRFTVNQLRHTAATIIRRDFGLDAARAVLGHTTPATTAIYAEVDQSRVRQVMLEVG